MGGSGGGEPKGFPIFAIIVGFTATVSMWASL